MDSVFDPAALDETYLFIVVSNPLTLGCALGDPHHSTYRVFPLSPQTLLIPPLAHRSIELSGSYECPGVDSAAHGEHLMTNIRILDRRTFARIHTDPVHRVVGSGFLCLL
jgi:hypothetical protein